MAQVSVVIPVYNIEQHLRQCLDSVVAQTLDDLEIICVDDGSTDTSLQILEEYAARDNRLQVISRKNSGPGAARNAGFERATGEFLIFLDSDDWFEPDFLELMRRQAKQTGADITICRAVEFDTQTGGEFPSEWMLKTRYLPDLVFQPEEIAPHLFQFTYGMAWDKLYARSFLMRTGLQFPTLRNSEDLAFVFPSLLAAKRIAVLPEVLLHHRVNRSVSVSNTRSSQPEAPYEAFRIVKEYLETQGQMELYERSFLNWAMEFLVWHVSNMNDTIIRRQYLQILRKEWLPSLPFKAHPPTYYEDKFTYCKYLLARYAPAFLFAGITDSYKAVKRLRYRGRLWKK